MRSTKAAIFIPTYKNRYDELLNCINDIEKYEVFVVFSSYDNIESYNEKYTWKDHIHTLVSDAPNIGLKRQFGLDAIYDRGFTYAIQFDDDNRSFGAKITPETKRTTSNSYAKQKISIEELVDKLVEVAEEYNAAFVSPSLEFNIGFSQPGKRLVNRSITSGQCTLQNVKMLHDNGLRYSSEELINEDIVLLFEILKKQLPCVTVGDYCYCVLSKSNDAKNSLVNYDDRYDLLHKNMYLKYPSIISLYLDKQNRIRIRTNWKNFPDHTDEIENQEFYDICKNEDLETVKKYIREH